MSFEPICPSCGAVSGPSVGVCPYCKTPFSAGHGEADATVDLLQKTYTDGKLDEALSLIATITKERPEEGKDVHFQLLAAKVLLESEAPLAQVKNLLTRAHLQEPTNPEVAEYLEIVDAKEKLEFGSKDLAEQTLKNLLRRSPKNVHALFLLGTHLFWGKKETDMSARYLQQCTQLRPNLLRAWACLGSIYKATGQPDLANRAFQKCLTLETHPSMINYFKKLMAA